MFSNRYIFTYATIMIIIVASILATAANILKPFQDQNVKNEKYKSILSTAGLIDENVKYGSEELEGLYNKYITKAKVINSKGEVIEGAVAFDVKMADEVKKPIDERKLPLYIAEMDNGEKEYVVPLRGKGLWGPVWGYIAIKDDGTTVNGANFGHKGETPGLGAEIVNKEFTEQFVGDKIFNEEGEFTSIAVVKGGTKADDLHGVDGISGGTITSNGVDDMLEDCLKGYIAYFKNLENFNKHE